jgi:hypothetical protein
MSGAEWNVLGLLLNLGGLLLLFRHGLPRRARLRTCSAGLGLPR